MIRPRERPRILCGMTRISSNFRDRVSGLGRAGWLQGGFSPSNRVPIPGYRATPDEPQGLSDRRYSQLGGARGLMPERAAPAAGPGTHHN